MFKPRSGVITQCSGNAGGEGQPTSSEMVQRAGQGIGREMKGVPGGAA